MTAISSGAVVRVHRHGDARWLVVGKTHDDRQWRVVSLGLDHRGLMRTSLSVGAGDLVVLTPALHLAASRAEVRKSNRLLENLEGATCP